MKRFLTLVVVLLMGTIAAQADFLVNAGFDDPGATGDLFGYALPLVGGQWDVYSAIPGWSGGSAGIEVQGTGAHSTPQRVELDTHNVDAGTDSSLWVWEDDFKGFNSTMSQTWTAGSYTPGTYELTFYYKIRTDRPGTLGDPLVGGLSTFAIGTFLNGVSQGVIDDLGATGWTKKMITFDLVSGDYTLMFSALGYADSFGGLLDSLSIERLGDAPPPLIPEPATSLFIGSGLIGLYLMRRRRRKA